MKINTFKCIIASAGMLAAACACNRADVLYDADYNILLDESNTYYAGEPVKFVIKGEVDNLLFYSGETGAQYKYKDRYQVPMEDVKSAQLDMTVLPQYGPNNGGLTIYITDQFEGITGSDADADRAAVNALFKKDADGNDIVPDGWKKIEWEEKSGKNTVISEDVSDYLNNFCLAFHWNPKGDPKTTVQRTYSVLKGASLTLDIEGSALTQTDLSSIAYKTLMMNDGVDPYKVNNGNGSMIFTNATYMVRFQGIAAGKLDYNIDGWYFTVPQQLNRIANDKGTVIKNMQNYLTSYEYTFDEPGTYNVVFVGRNENYEGSSEKIIEMTVTILPKL